MWGNPVLSSQKHFLDFLWEFPTCILQCGVRKDVPVQIITSSQSSVYSSNAEWIQTFAYYLFYLKILYGIFWSYSLQLFTLTTPNPPMPSCLPNSRPLFKKTLSLTLVCAARTLTGVRLSLVCGWQASSSKKTDSPFSRSPQLSVDHKLGVGSHGPFQFRVRMLTALVLWRSQ